MKNNIKPRHSLVAVVSIVIGLMLGPVSQAQAGNTNPGAISPQDKAYGKTYGEWSVRWWQFVSMIPWPHNPTNDPTGANCTFGQKGKVWFLTGAFFTASATLTRNCTVPASKAIFFPVINAEADNLTCADPDTTFSIKELRKLISDPIDTVTNLAVEIDGVALPNYRVQSPVFSYTLPDDNYLKALGCSDALVGTYGPAVSDGYWVMLAPLSVGKHTLHFKGTYGTSTLDVTYQLTIVPGGDHGDDEHGD
jgi:hypothetical protein